MVARCAAALACCVLAVGLGACGGDEDEPAATTPAPAATQPAPATQPAEPEDAAGDEKAERREKRAREKPDEEGHRKSEEPRRVTERPHAAREGGGDDDADARPPKVQDRPGNSDSGYIPED
jgi:hypothetical protein